MQRGRFITFEGTEGVGKSTQQRRLAAWLGDAGVNVLATREPGGTPTAERVRDVLLQPEIDDALPPLAELLLMFAAREVHTRNRIAPALTRGTWVLCDRYTDATRAYQGAGRGMSGAIIDTLAHWVQGELQPDCTILLDAPVTVGLARARARAGAAAADRFEREAEPFFERVRDAYLDMASADPERFLVVDASQGEAEVAGQIRAAVAARYGRYLPAHPPAAPGRRDHD